MAHRKIHVVINPVAGQDTPILNIVNRVFQESDVEWDVSITKKSGDALKQTRQAVNDGADVVAAYGGDGTVAEVASGLVRTKTLLAILPGGTANVMSIELGIPTDLTQACRIACDPHSVVRPVDLGRVNKRWFILRVGVGFEATMVEGADRELKDRFGVLAYLWSAVQNLVQPQIAHYQLNIDGHEFESEGLTCIIANSTNLGQAGVNLVPNASVSDGLLDVIVVQQASLRSLFDILGSITGMKQMQVEDKNIDISKVNVQIQQNLQYWQGKKISIVTEPVQTVQFDGEVLGKVAIECKVVPEAVGVLTPLLPASGENPQQTSKDEPKG
jgi:YegS/Rv2252/BmrU family lipid kinase